jgi:hypothetical protein
MPSADQITSSLQQIIAEARSASPILRLLFAALVVLFVSKRRVLAAYLAAYVALASVAVAVIAVAFENAHIPLYFVLFFPLGLLWGREALTLPENPRNSLARFALGGLFGLGALFYPHFVEGAAGALLFAPLGIVPCPTLILAHAALIATARSYSLYTAIPTWRLGAFFGVAGVFYLGVKVDWLLVAAVPVSLAVYFASKRPSHRARRRPKRRK